MQVLVLSASQILSLSPFGLIQEMEQAFEKLTISELNNFQRVVNQLSNGKLGLNPHQGVVVLFDAQSGEPVAIANGFLITSLRTAAASAGCYKFTSTN